MIRAGSTGIIAVDISLERLTSVVAEAAALNPSATIMPSVTDIASAPAVAAMVALAVQTFGRINYSVHCAGVGTAEFTRTDQTDMAEFERVVGVNLRGTFLCSKEVLGVMAAQEVRVLAYAPPPSLVVGQEG